MVAQCANLLEKPIVVALDGCTVCKLYHFFYMRWLRSAQAVVRNQDFYCFNMLDGTVNYFSNVSLMGL